MRFTSAILILIASFLTAFTCSRNSPPAGEAGKMDAPKQEVSSPTQEEMAAPMDDLSNEGTEAESGAAGGEGNPSEGSNQ